MGRPHSLVSSIDVSVCDVNNACVKGAIKFSFKRPFVSGIHTIKDGGYFQVCDAAGETE